ncbi:MAG: NAD(P)-dependent oxidoreductase [Myxococcota bacterium]
MKIAIVGASGTLGRVMTRRWAQNGDTLSLLLRRSDPELEVMARCRTTEDWVFDAEALREVVSGAEVVVNLAARNPQGQDRDLQETESFLRVNALGPALVASACRSAGVPLLHFSTVAVYEVGQYRESALLGEEETLPDQDRETIQYFEALSHALREALATPSGSAEWLALGEALKREVYPQQASVYGLTKLIGERLVLEVGKPVCAIRLSDVFGPGHESRGVIVDHLRALARANQTPGASVDVNLDFRATAHFIYIEDVLRAARGLVGRLVEPAVSLPDVVNLVGHCLDQRGLKAALEGLAQRRASTLPTFTEAQHEDVTYDRRYGSDRISSVLPGFSLSNLDTSLDETWDALTKS